MRMSVWDVLHPVIHAKGKIVRIGKCHIIIVTSAVTR